MHIDEQGFEWVYRFTATLGLLLALFLPSATRRVTPARRQTYLILQAITLAGAIVGAKLAMMAGDLMWPVHAVSLDEVLYSGKSLLGGLLGGFIAAEIAKPFFDYREPPNDWFATKLVLSVAVGRLGCVLAGCCRGIATQGPLAVTYSDGIARVPVTTLELLFHLALFVVFWVMFRRGLLAGRLFALYAILYGAFRMATEPLRETPKLASGWSVYQLFALLLLAVGVWSMRRRWAPPAEVAA